MCVFFLIININKGAADDLDRVTKMAYSIVGIFGMNPKLGQIAYPQKEGEMSFNKPYSEATAQVLLFTLFYIYIILIYI